MTRVNELPPDLVARGYKLITREPGRMFAVSPQWGCTGTKQDIGAVVSEARGMVRFIEYISRKSTVR